MFRTVKFRYLIGEYLSKDIHNYLITILKYRKRFRNRL